MFQRLLFLVLLWPVFSIDSATAQYDPTRCLTQVDSNNRTFYTMVDAPPGTAKETESTVRIFRENIRHPRLCLQGKLYFEWIVEPDGRHTHFKVLRTPHPELSAEVERVFQLLPDWVPGTCQGNPVPVRMIASFSLDMNSGGLKLLIAQPK